MALQIRRGTNAQRLTITPASGELIYTTDTKSVFIGDGMTIGGVAVTAFTQEDAQDAVRDLFDAGTHTGITFTYDDLNNSISAVVTGGGGGLADLVDDTTPQLGGALDLNGYNIAGSGNINIVGTIEANSFVGSVFADNSSVMVDAINGTFNGDLTGNVTGNVTGNITGDVQGNVTGNVTGNVVALDTTVLFDASTKQIGDIGIDIFGNLTGDVTGNVTGDLFSGNIHVPNDVLNSLNVLGVTTGSLGGIPYLTLSASKGTTLSPTNTAAGDILAGLALSGYYGGGFKSGGVISSRWTADATLTDNAPKSEVIVLTNSGGSGINYFFMKSNGVLSAPAFQASAVDPSTGSATPFADATARDAKITSPQVGMICYVEDNGSGVPKFQGYIGGGSPGWVDLH